MQNRHRFKRCYISPLILGTPEILLETDLLVGSVSYSSMVETAGQENGGYFENDEVVTTDNLWGD